jgi:hypothetical protein
VFRSFATRSPVAKNRGGRSHQLGLNEKIAEDRVSEIGWGNRENDLGIAGKLDRALVARKICDHDPADLNVVLG